MRGFEGSSRTTFTAARGWQWFLSVCALGCGMIQPQGCSGGSAPFSTQENPTISVLVGDNLLSKGVCAHFAPDESDGFNTQTIKVSVSNTGASGTLCINKAAFVPTNAALMKISWGAHTVDTSKCPGAFASLEPAHSLVGNVTYTPSPGLSGSATLSFDHNDSADPTKFQTLCFDISQVGPKVILQTSELPFINPKANQTEKCAYIVNEGSDPLVFDSCFLVPSSPEYTITQQPAKGATIPPLGSPDNKPDNKMTLKCCLTMTPDGNPDNDDVQLVFKTNDQASPEVKTHVYTKFEEPSVFELSSPNANTKDMTYNFCDAASGATKANKVQNMGPSPWSWNNAPKITPQPNSPATQEQCDAVFALSLKRDGVKWDPPWTAGSIAANHEVDFVITYTQPAAGNPPACEVKVTWNQVPLSGILEWPIVAGACGQTPTLTVSTSELWLWATSGKKAVGRLAFANNSAGPLDVIKACINSKDPPGGGADPCSSAQYLSTFTGLVTPVGFSTLSPSATGSGNGLLTMDVEFHPPNDNKINSNDLLHIVYCETGSVAGKDCAFANQTIHITGNTTAGITLPTIALSVDTSKPGVGKPLNIAGAITIGSFPTISAWNWAIIDRPAGSHAWIGSASMATTTPGVSFVPDVSGTYTVQALVLTISASDPSQIGWSVPTKLDIVIP